MLVVGLLAFVVLGTPHSSVSTSIPEDGGAAHASEDFLTFDGRHVLSVRTVAGFALAWLGTLVAAAVAGACPAGRWRTIALAVAGLLTVAGGALALTTRTDEPAWFAYAPLSDTTEVSPGFVLVPPFGTAAWVLIWLATLLLAAAIGRALTARRRRRTARTAD